MKRERSIHPACLALPRLPAKAFDGLCESIKAIGLQQPILVDGTGTIVDGKNREAACEQVGVEPRYQQTTIVGDPVAFVFSLNRHRLRKAGQLALAGARLATAGDGNPKLTSPNGEVGMTRDEVSAALGISARAIDRAKFVLAHGVPELLAYLESGEITLGCAEWVAKAKHNQQAEACAIDAKAVRALALTEREKANEPERAAKHPLQFHQAVEEARQWARRWGHLGPLAGVCDAITAIVEQREAVIHREVTL